MHFPALEVEHPIVTTRIVSPHLLRISKQQHLLLILAERHVIHRLLVKEMDSARLVHNELLRRNQHRLALILG